MTGWKTWAAAGIAGVIAVLQAIPAEALPWAAQAVPVLIAIGTALGLVGLGHKIEKSK